MRLPQPYRRTFLSNMFKAAALYSAAPFASLLLSGAAMPAMAARAFAQENEFDVKKFGAKGDGKTLDSPAINAAIDAAATSGGGTIYFPPGIYVSASIRLKSNITLYLENGATLEAVDWKIAPYDLPEPNEAAGNYQDFGHSHWQNSLIWGVGLHNIAIVGGGLIHGKGLNCGFDRFAGETDGMKYKDGGPGEGNKSIALRECNNVVLRDFSILHGGHFGILATGVSNMLIDNVKIDTNRDGMDIDACNNVRISRCSVNSPWDDGICLKASYGLAKVWHCENITISDCYVCGSYDEGSLLDGTFKRSLPEYKSYSTGRIKLGTESNGDFRNITITNCVFDGCRGLALESVDGSHIEDISISNITMRDAANDPIFIRLGARLRGPNNSSVGSIKRVNISNLVVHNADGWFATTISGLPDHPVEDIQLSNLRIESRGGGRKDQRSLVPPENPAKYPEPGMFGEVPAYAFYLRHLKGVSMDHVKTTFMNSEARSALVLEDVEDASFTAMNLQQGQLNASYFELRNVRDFSIKNSKNISDTRIQKVVKNKIL